MTKRVIYWLSRAIRLHENPALLKAQEIALENKVPLEVRFYALPNFPYANARNMDVILKSLVELSSKLGTLNIPLTVKSGSFMDDLENEKNEILAIVTEHAVLRYPRAQHLEVYRFCQSHGIPFHRINTACVVPVYEASPKLEYAAKTFRPKIMAQYKNHLKPIQAIQNHPYSLESYERFNNDQAKELYQYYADKAPFPTDFKAGEDAALSQLDSFIKYGLQNYHLRNEVDAQATSHLSAYLHFGLLSPVKMIREVENTLHPNAALFVEEALIRRELAENFCYYQPKYDSLDGAWDWAKATLDRHRSDPRPYVYTQGEFEQGLTHDEVWNECQRRVRDEAYLHGYLRMYWAKKVLEWSSTPEEALTILLYLNDTYFLDGRDPNGYTGILWSIAGVHDRPWFEKPIFGLVRVMSRDGTLKKTKLKLK